MTSSKQFRYDHELAIGEIRLLLIWPGSRSDAINMSILYKDQGDVNVEYHALSYVWGSPVNPISVTCDGQPLLITHNLHQALLQLRDNGLTGPIWVDAICIDQSNIDERTRRVRMMRQIYSEAELVHIWLGEATTYTKLGVDLIPRVSRTLQQKSKTGFHRHSLDDPEFPSSNDPAWKSVADILTRPWFERIWVIQERMVAQACEYMCGPHTISSDALKSLTRDHQFVWQLQQRLLANKPPGVDGNMVYRGLQSPVMSRIHAEQGYTLMEWIIWTSAHKATDPRDKIFALIGLTTSVPLDLIDYRKELRQVLTDLGVLFLRQGTGGFTSSLHVLSFVNHAHRSLDLPSWIPEWTYAYDSFFALSLIMLPKEHIEVGKASYTVEDTNHNPVRETTSFLNRILK